METTQFNSEKNQRLQELYEKTIKRCNSEAKNRFWGLAIAVIIVGALVFGVLDVQLWQKLSCVAILAVLALFDWWKTKQIYSVMSQAGDVNELLRANEECKKKLIKLNKWMVIPVLVAWMIAHYKGRFDGSLLYDLIFISFIIFLISLCEVTWGHKDWDEVKEIKEIVSAD